MSVTAFVPEDNPEQQQTKRGRVCIARGHWAYIHIVFLRTTRVLQHTFPLAGGAQHNVRITV